MRSLILIVFAGFLGIQGMAQETKAKDSLLNLLKVSGEDSGRVKLYLALSDQCLKDDLKEAEKYAALAGGLSKRIGYRKGEYGYYDAYSNVYMRTGKFDSILYMGNEAMTAAKKYGDSLEVGRIMLNIGLAYKYQEDFETAVSYIEGGRDLLIRNGVHKYDGEIFNLLQLLYQAMRQYRKGVDNGLLAVQELGNSGDKGAVQFTYSNLGLNYVFLHQYDSAKYYLKKAEELIPVTGESLIPITISLNYALIALKQQELDGIKIYVTKALALSRKYAANEFIAWAQYGLAYYYLLKKDYANCRLQADSALALAERYNIRDVKQKIYPVLSSLYYAMQDSKKGYHYFNQYELLSDSILNESITRSTIQTEKRFETERKEAQIILQQAQLKQQTSLNYFLIAGAAALLFILILVYLNYRNRQRLQQAKIDELEKEKQLTVTEALLKGEEQERTRLAKDLHDGLGGMLSGIKYSLNTMKENLVENPDTEVAFERSIDMLDSSIREMRRVAHNMMPEMLLKYGLDTALKSFCDEIEKSGIIHIAYQSIGMQDAEIKIGQTAAISVYRIVQELVSNAVRHAAANHLLVQLHVSPQEELLSLTVEDDGKGFDMKTLKNASGIGWSNIQNRVEFLKGRIDVNSSADKGTSVLIEIKF